jgi:hypothetical protein
MTAGWLRRVPGEFGAYAITDSLDGVKPGRRIVRDLIVSRIGAGTREGLRPLAGFERLRALELDRMVGVDLAPLSALRSLQTLRLFDLKECFASQPLILPSLRELTVILDRPGLVGASVRALLEAIDASELPQLCVLDIAVALTPRGR